MTSSSPSRERLASAGGADRTLGLLRAGYPYLLRLRQELGTDAMRIRLLGRRATVVSGPDGARLFYDESVMRRRGAIPLLVRIPLFGSGAVHGLDGARHEHRKQLFVSLLTDAAARRIAALAGKRWRARSLPQTPPEAFDAAVEVHAAAALEWCGLPAGTAAPGLAQDLLAMVDGFGSVGLRYVRARRARRRADQWATRVIDRTRRGLTEVPADSAVAAIARHLDERGRLLPPHVAGVELLNLLRPTVAVAYFVAFAAHQLSIDDEIADRLRAEDDDALLEAFSHELRRIYPFVPVLAAKVRRRSTFRGARLPRGQRVLLDVYGSLHDPAHWEDVEEFRLDRFCGVEPDPFRYFPQGGGDVARGHRCPGERVAVELLKVATRVLLDAKPSDSRYPIPLRRMPTRPLPA